MLLFNYGDNNEVSIKYKIENDQDDCLVSFFDVLFGDNYCYIDSIKVEAGSRGQGLGTLAVKAFIDKLNSL